MSRQSQSPARVETFKKAKILQSSTFKLSYQGNGDYEKSDLDQRKSQLSSFPAEIKSFLEEANKKVLLSMHEKFEEITLNFAEKAI
jgi:hypothetical protein